MNTTMHIMEKIVNEYNNAYHGKIKMKPIDIKDKTHIEIYWRSYDIDPKFKVGDNVRVSKYENIFAKEYTPNCFKEIFLIKTFKNSIQWTYVINDLNGEEIIGTFYDEEMQKINQKELRLEKVTKRKRSKLYVKWKGYNNSFANWIGKKNLN